MRTLARWLVGLLAMIGVLAAAAVVAVVYLIKHAEPEKVAVRNGDYLVVDFDRGVSGQPPRDAIEALGRGDEYVFSDLVAALRRAAADPKISGLAAHLGGTPIPAATALELADAVSDFKKVGKKTFLFSESLDGGPGAVALAAAFQETWVQPSGLVGLRGLAIESPFLRQGLAEWGIRADVLQRYEYKSAFDSFTRDEMSPPVRENLQHLIDDVAASLNAAIARERGLDISAVAALAQRGPLLAPDALQAKLVDRLGYGAEFQAELKAAFPGAPVQADAYAATREAPDTDIKIALIQASGQIVPGETEFGPLGGEAMIGAQTVAHAIRDAARTKGVRAIILRLDTPGGDYAASDTIRQAILAARHDNVPVVVSMGNVAASGGYFIASAAETVIAGEATITGSIGVIAGKVVLDEAWNKLGVRWATLKTGETATMFSPNHPFTPLERARMEAIVDAAYADFTQKVGEARKLDAEAVDRVARGRVWSGKAAKAVGLVDDTGGLLKALAYAKRSAGIPAERIPTLVDFPRARSLTETLSDLMNGEHGEIAKITAAPLPEPLATLSAWSKLNLEKGAALMPPMVMR
ncbi:Periplasmic serine protease [uncultured Alphaproteobacteria bacterium]|uniref:Periplasmic serine protease n=1 Tax=uncultured Alphaproteobacteria bacterium TaxID=91750 RepID=A0A212JJI8_9PROT|nr:Periplasmic serine protease [uncultured Alphaproteobacteria bacterium]